MKYIKISNSGILDERLIPLMGGTTKRNDKFKIGQFGTGLKYVLAYMLRNNLDLKIFCGEREVKITSVEKRIQGQVFNIVCIDGVETSITAQMGHEWKPWMIIREIWCNALDEGEATRSIESDCVGKDDTTTFYLEASIEFLTIWNNWTKYFIQDFEPLYSCDTFALHPGTDKLRLYKHGVLIKELENEAKTIFSYDIKDASINELREFIGHVDAEIEGCINNLDDRKLITYFLETCTEDHYEGKMSYDWSYSSFGKVWSTVIGNAKIIHKEAIETIHSKGLDIDLTGVLCVPKKLYKALTKKFQGIGALRTVDKINEFYETHSIELELIVKQALVVLERCDYYIHPELKFIFGVFGDKKVLAKVSLDKKEIYISERMKEQSLFQFVTMLIEENEHFNTGFQDHTREFQQHFINLYTKTLLTKHEIRL